MTNPDQTPTEPSINDNLPTSNPSLKSVLTFFGCLAAAIVLLFLYAEYGPSLSD